MRVVYIVLTLMVCSTSGDLLGFLEPRNPETHAAVEVLANENDLSSNSLAVIFVTNEPTNPVAEDLSRLTLGRSSPVSVYLAPVGVVKDAAEGKIIIFREGRRVSYHGVPDATVILKYISLIEGSGLKTIANKLDKMAFERTRGTRLVGYFAAGSSELAVFEEAAKLFGSQVAFFVVTDAVVAKHVKLNVTGQIYLFGDFDKMPILCPQNPATLADIQRLIVRNRESFVKVTPMNVRNPSFNESSSILLITDSSPLSFHLLKLIARMQRNNTMNNSRILWIDSDDFPLVDVVSRPIHGLTKLPGLGFWDPSTSGVEWLDLTILNVAPADRLQEDLNLLHIKTFISSRFPSIPPSATPAPESVKTEL